MNSRAALLLLAGLLATPVDAQDSFVGPRKCGECHEPEHAVWLKTAHAEGFEKFATRNQELIDKVFRSTMSMAANMREEEVCKKCHLTASAGEAPVAAVSCEKCHGAAGVEPDGYLRVHSDYGNRKNEKEAETPEHRAKRLEESAARGLLLPDMLYDIAASCMACHGLAHPDVDPAILSNMMEAGHPLKQEYELVRYSQGEVLHRFYPVPQPKTAANQTSPPAHLARLFVVGQLAKLVSASRALEESTDENYITAQKQRLEAARKALEKLPEVQELLVSPSDALAREVWGKIRDRDLLSLVKDQLPAAADYLHSKKYK